ncbi:DUF397 domain-containing protein [Streptomyces sp. B1866]|uniref:DUF397 domain-containing protein n=1 Tax=Streptomyces sp. B1866 TaxID=3075431 RepID=UPI00288DADF0|nr:DUF397 domain-containing protein [Streptomyces sp. B1866]MDT3397342.1 DUF397 domain-containing protein [Streptomyces sp. B1866]
MTADITTAMAPDLTGADWFTSSYTDNGQACVEVADLTRASYGRVAVRDSKNPTGPALLVAPDAWGSFVATVKGEEHPA